MQAFVESWYLKNMQLFEDSWVPVNSSFESRRTSHRGIRRETGMPRSLSSNIQRSRRTPTHSRQEGRTLLVEAAFGFDFFNYSSRRHQRLTCDGWTSWSLQIDLREWPRSWRSAASFIIACLLRQETFFRRTVTVVWVIDASILVVVLK